MLYPALLCVLLLLLSPLRPTESRALYPPNSNNAMQFLEQVLDRYNDLLTQDDLENLTDDQSEQPLQPYGSAVKVAEYPKWADLPAQSSDNSWLRLIRTALANQKRAVPDRVRRGWNRGCFGLKLDRIGSMSGLGC
ncbi:C-type natriuretic peptide-like isoform X2 [Engraulis encrasicolus]